MTRNYLGPIEDLAADLGTIAAALEHLTSQFAMHPIPSGNTDLRGIRDSFITAEIALTMKTKALNSALEVFEEQGLMSLRQPE